MYIKHVFFCSFYIAIQQNLWIQHDPKLWTCTTDCSHFLTLFFPSYFQPTWMCNSIWWYMKEAANQHQLSLMKSLCTASYYPPTEGTTTLISSWISCVPSYTNCTGQITEQNTGELQLKSHPWQITNNPVWRWAITYCLLYSVPTCRGWLYNMSTTISIWSEHR